MMKKIQKIIFICVILLFGCITFVYADSNTELHQKIYSVNYNKGIGSAALYIAGWIRYFGIIVCVIVLMTKGIKFITSAAEGKAEVKKELIPWFVGLVLLVASRLLLNWLIPLANPINDITEESISCIKNIMIS